MGADQARAEVITEAKEMKANAKKAKLKAVQLAIQVRQKGIQQACLLWRVGRYWSW
jgi:hypothetical protein